MMSGIYHWQSSFHSPVHLIKQEASNTFVPRLDLQAISAKWFDWLLLINEDGMKFF